MGDIITTAGGLGGEHDGDRLIRRTRAIQATQHCDIFAAQMLAAEQIRAEDRAARAAGERSSHAGPKKLLTVAEVATELSLPRNRVYELTKSGTLPCVRIDTSVRVRREALDAFIAGGGTKPRDG